MGGGGQFAEYGGINPDLEPELAMALKVSLQEEAARNKPADDAKNPDEVKATDGGDAGDVQMTQMPNDDNEEHDEEYYLQQAINFSLQPENVLEKKDDDKIADKQDLKDIVTTDFMKDIISDLKLDIDESAVDNILD